MPVTHEKMYVYGDVLFMQKGTFCFVTRVHFAEKKNGANVFISTRICGHRKFYGVVRVSSCRYEDRSLGRSLGVKSVIRRCGPVYVARG